MSFSRQLRWHLEYECVGLLELLLLILPWTAKRWVGRVLGRIAFRFLPRRRKVTMENLQAAFPDEDDSALVNSARGSFEHLGRLLIEIIYQKNLARREISLSEIEGWDNLQKVARNDRGYFLASGHFGNWEMVAHMQAALGYPLLMVTRPLDNPFLERYFAARRENTGNEVIHKKNAVKVMTRGLRAGKGIAFMVDQYFGEKSRVLVPFFGRDAATTPVMGRLAADLKVPVLPVFAYPQDKGRYKIVYETPIYPPNDGDRKSAALQITTEMTGRLEQAIRKDRKAWFWMHRRWRKEAENHSG